MPNLVFNRLTITSDTQKSGNQFEFRPGLNLITGDDNSLGKSTVAKMLLWSLGCDPEFDTTWKSFDVRAVVEFVVGNSVFEAGRHGDSMFLRTRGGEWKHYSKITGQYAAAFADMVGFRALLPNREDSTRLETPPPAFYFLPFYVDQRRSWTQAWNSFSKLEQYARWQKTIIQYHTGYLLPAYFELEERIAERSLVKKAAEAEVRRIETALEVVKEYLPPMAKTVTLTGREFDALASEVNNDVSSLQEAQEELLHLIAETQSERQYLLSQLELAKVAASELESDYTFSVENIDGDTLQCPLCGVLHDNSLASRASILADKSETERQVKLLDKKIAALDKNAEKSQEKLNLVRAQIEEINKKYASRDELPSQQNSEFSLVDALASQSVQRRVQQTRESKAAVIREISTANRGLRKEQKELLTKEETDHMDSYFKDKLSEYVDDLRAQGVNLAPIESPLDYKKLYGSGGAAESTRGMLAYHMAIIRQIHMAQNEAFAPVIIDTPNQQEQADFNYQRIMSFLLKTIPPNAQFILCAMNREEVKKFKELAHVINLDERKTLIPKKYVDLRPQLAFFDSTL